MNLNKISWYFNRLNKMSIREILWRIGQKKKTIDYSNKYIRDKYLITSKNLFDISYNIYLDQFDIGFLLLGQDEKHINTIPERIFDNFEVEKMGKYNIPDWHSTYHKGDSWLFEFSTKLNIKQRDDIGDPRVAWEINRLHYFPSIALKYAVTKDKSYLELLNFHFYSWVKSNPFFWGINWTSPMEAAIRNISFLFTLYYLSKDTESNLVNNLMKDIQVAILNQNEYISDFYSQYSSANNHLIIEMVSMNLVAKCFGMDNFQTKTQKILEKEIIQQTYEDGVNKEQAIHYHAFVLESLLIWIKFCKDKHCEVSPTIINLIQRMAEYIADMMDENGNVPALGDSDEGKIISFSCEKHYVMVLDLASLIFEKQYSPFGRITSPTINAIRWKSDDNIKKYEVSENKIYPHGGKAIFRRRINKKEIFITFEFGNLGLPSLFAHGHADALSINLHVNGIPIFIDSGTYLYNIDYSVRNKLRLPEAHNTIIVENDNFANPKGSFIWEDSYKVSFNTMNNSVKATLTTNQKNKIQRELKIVNNEFHINDKYESIFKSNFILNPILQLNKRNDNYYEIFYEGELLCTFISENEIKQNVKEYSPCFTLKRNTNSIYISGLKQLSNKIIF